MGDNQEFKEENARALIGTVDWDSGGDFPNRKALIIDPVNHSILTTDYGTHHEIHAGEFHSSVLSALTDTGGEIDLLFKSPSIVPGFGATGHPWDNPIRRKAHMTVILVGALAYTFRFFKQSTRTFVPGNANPIFNRNLHAIAASEKLYTSGMSICHTSGGSETSVKIYGPIHIGSTTSGGRSDTGGVTGGRNEFVLESDDWYRVRMISRADANALTIFVDWYEHAERTDNTG